MTILIAFLVFSLLILTHELGHFLLAKKNGIRVREFSIGFGPKIVRFTKGGTEYSVGVVLFGGVCVMEGEDEENEAEDSFSAKPPAARLSVLAAGPIFNFILAFFLALFIIGSVGIDYAKLAGVTEGSPADEAGLEAGDLITGINGSTIFCFRDISLFMMTYQGDAEVTITYEREGEEYSVTFWPMYDTSSASFYLGIHVYTYRTQTSGIVETLRLSVHEVRYWMSYTIASLKELLQGEADVSDLSGPVGIVSMVGEVVEESMEDGVFYVLLNLANLAMLLSVNLGVLNLFPFPALDGGRIVFVLVELVTGKALPREKEGMVHLAGMVLLLLLMVFVFYNDICRLLAG